MNLSNRVILYFFTAKGAQKMLKLRSSLKAKGNKTSSFVTNLKNYKNDYLSSA